MYDINPGSGQPMVGGIAGVDIVGNPWGVQLPWSSAYPVFGSDW